jgi:hypothetical protein
MFSIQFSFFPFYNYYKTLVFLNFYFYTLDWEENVLLSSLTM